MTLSVLRSAAPALPPPPPDEIFRAFLRLLERLLSLPAATAREKP